MKDIKEFTTTDLGLIASLVTCGFSYTDAVAQTPTKVVFKFNEEELLRKATTAYYSNGLKVPASSFYNNIKSIRGVINEILRNSPKS